MLLSGLMKQYDIIMKNTIFVIKLKLKTKNKIKKNLPILF